MKYKLFSADPPWNYGNTISNGAAEDHYGTMKMEDMKRLPIWTMAEDDAVLAMWYTGTHTEEAVELAEAWGFQVRQMFLFTWVKLNMKAEERLNKQLENGEIFDAHDVMAWLNKEVKINAGNYSRQNQESMLVAVRGKGLERKSASVRQIIISCPGEHSEKPKEALHRLVELYGDVPRIELFARESLQGWHTWGNQCASNSVELRPASFCEPFDWKDPKSPWNPNNNLQHWQGSAFTKCCDKCGIVYHYDSKHVCAVPMNNTVHVKHCPKCLLCYASDSVHVCPSSGE